MVAVARRDHPYLRFDVGSMTGLDLPDGALGGVLAWYSLIHTPPPQLPAVITELARVLRLGGLLLTAFQVGDERVHPTGGRKPPTPRTSICQASVSSRDQ